MTIPSQMGRDWMGENNVGGALDQQQRQFSNEQVLRDLAALGITPGRYGGSSPTGQPTPQQQYFGTPQQGNKVSPAPVATAQDDDNKLLGYAKYWDIPPEVAQAMPREVLIQHINSMRQHAASEMDTTDAAIGLAAVPAAFATGAAESAFHLLNKTPILPQFLKDMLHLNQAEQWAASLQEGVRASIDPTAQEAIDPIATVGKYSADAAFATVAWRMAGVPAKGLGFMGPIAKAGAQGAATTWLMGEAAPGHRENMLAGAAMGAGGEYLIPKVLPLVAKYAPAIRAAVTKIDQAFSNPFSSSALRGAAADGSQALAESPYAGLGSRAGTNMPLDPAGYGTGPVEGTRITTSGTTDYTPSIAVQRDHFLNLSEDMNISANQRAQYAEVARTLGLQVDAAGQGLRYNNVMTPELQTKANQMLQGGADVPELMSSLNLPYNEALSARQAFSGSSASALTPAEASRVLTLDEVANTLQAGARRAGGGGEEAWNEAGSRLVQQAATGAPITGADIERELGAFGLQTLRQTIRPTTGLAGAEVSQAAAATTKASIVTGSPNLPEITARTAITDATAVEAAVATNPGGVNIIPGVADPAATIAGIETTQANVAYRFARGPGAADGQYDVLVSNGTPITDDMVSQYQRTGFHTGMDVVTAKGTQARVVDVMPNGNIKIQGAYGSRIPPHIVKPETLSASAMTKGLADIPGMYENFQAYVEGALSDARAAVPGADMGSFLEPRVPGGLSGLREKFFTEQGLTHPADRALIGNYFDARFIEDLQGLAPEAIAAKASIDQQVAALETAPEASRGTRARGGVPDQVAAFGSPREALTAQIKDLSAQMREAPDQYVRAELYNQQQELIQQRSDLPAESLQAATPSGPVTPGVSKATPAQDLEELANSKGYTVVPKAGSTAFQLLDNQSNMSILLNNEGAVQEFLRKSPESRLPEIDPLSNAPMEVAGSMPTSKITEPRLGSNEHVDRMVEDVINEDHNATVQEHNDALRQSGLPAEAQEGMALDTDAIDAPQANPELRAQMAELKAKGRVGNILRAHDGVIARRWRTMNARFKLLERSLAENGVDAARPWADYQQVSQGMDVSHNWQGPWHDRAGDIFAEIRQAHMRSGDWTRIYEIEDAGARLAAAQKAGMNEKEIAAFDQLDSFYKDIFGETGIDPARQIKRYISHVREAQAQGLTGDDAYLPKNFLSPETDFFAEHARDGNLQFREMDPRVLTAYYVRSLGFKRFVAEPWESAIRTWNQVGADADMKPIADVFLDWAKLVKRGYTPGHDVALDVLHSVMNKFVPMTKNESAQIINGGLSNIHRSLLGFRPDVLLRDSIQPLLAVPRVGGQLFQTMAEYGAGSAEVKQAMWQRALDNGWVQRGMPRIEAPGALERGTSLPEGDLLGQQIRDSKRRAIANAASDIFHDFVSPALRPLGGKLDPLYFYARLGERNRLFVGEAGYQHAAKNIAAWRSEVAAAMEGGNPASAPTVDSLLDRANVTTYDQPVQRRFADLINAGQDDKAAALMGNELANVTQFRYGTREAPEAYRSLTGKLGMQFGNFSTQFHGFLSESLRNNSLGQNVQFLGWLGAVSGALHLAKKETGWDFDKWQFASSLTFVGSPWAKSAADLAEGAFAASSALNGRPTTFAQQQAMSAAAAVPGQWLSNMNPLGGLNRTLGGIASAMQAPDQADAFGRLAVTGDRGTQRQYAQYAQQSPTPGVFNPAAFSGMAGDPGGGAAVPFSALPAPGAGLAALPAVPLPGRDRPDFGSPANAVYRGSANIVMSPDSAAAMGAAQADRVYMRNGYPVYDTTNRTSDGKVPTHRLDVPSGRQQGETWEQYEARVNATPISAFPQGVQNVTRDIQALVPEVQAPFAALIAAARAQGLNVQINETFRPQQRQEYLFKQGRSLPGGPVTWTLTSDHSSGRAVDFMVGGQGDAGYAQLRALADSMGFKTMGPSDPGHIAMPAPGAPDARAQMGSSPVRSMVYLPGDQRGVPGPGAGAQ